MPTDSAGYHTLDSISTNDPRPRWDVSVRLTLESLESGSFRARIRDESQNFRSPNAGWQRAMSVENIYKYEFFVSNAPSHKSKFCTLGGKALQTS